MVHVAVHYIERTTLAEDSQKVARIDPGPGWVETWDDFASHRPDLIIVSTGPLSMDKKVHLEPLTVDIAQDVHQPRLNPATVHSANNMEDTRRHSKPPW